MPGDFSGICGEEEAGGSSLGVDLLLGFAGQSFWTDEKAEKKAWKAERQPRVRVGGITMNHQSFWAVEDIWKRFKRSKANQSCFEPRASWPGDAGKPRSCLDQCHGWRRTRSAGRKLPRLPWTGFFDFLFHGISVGQNQKLPGIGEPFNSDHFTIFHSFLCYLGRSLKQSEVREGSELLLDLHTTATANAEKLGVTPEMWSFDASSGKWTMEPSDMEIDGVPAENANRRTARSAESKEVVTRREERRKKKKGTSAKESWECKHVGNPL